MQPLKVALIFKSRSGIIERDHRAMGWWSYPVPEFFWEFFPARDNMDLNQFRDYDLMFHEDTARVSYIHNPKQPPLVYLDIDSSLSESHYQHRLPFARQANLVLVDHDDLSRFKHNGNHVRRLAYCVNDHVFKPLDKTLDICYHCAAGESRGLPGGKERNEIRRFLGEYASRSGYSLRAGAVGLDEYSTDMGASRVTVNWPRTMINRPHRVFDAMACRSAILTGPIPMVLGDCLEWGTHYLNFTDHDELGANLKNLLDGAWESYADAGYDQVMKRHTWAVRAQELRQILREELGL